jgi:hypothetical protein
VFYTIGLRDSIHINEKERERERMGRETERGTLNVSKVQFSEV